MLSRTVASRQVGALGVRALSTAAPVKPADARFGSGPVKKRPGFTLDALNDAALGRSHRSKLGKAKLLESIELSKEILGLPEGYKLGIVPGSDTGAYEMAMWTMLGAKPVDVFHWESFGKGWAGDATDQLKLADTAVHGVKEYGELADLSKARKEADICFTWNGTTSGVKVPNADWIPADREGLTFCDATSAVFAMDLDWAKIDVCTYSWQKVLGGEGAHGVLVLSPRAVERLESFKPDRALPKVFRLTKKGKLIDDIFKGATINTPSMLAVEDNIDSLKWANSVGGLKGLIKISNTNLDIVKAWVDKSPFASFLAKDPATVSNTSICLSLDGISKDGIKKMTALLESENVALDIGSYRDAPPGLRIWGGATVENSDMEKLMPWLTYAYEQCKDQ